MTVTRARLLQGTMLALACAAPGLAQTTPDTPPPGAVRTGSLSFSPQTVLKLIDLLVANGSVAREQADALIADAQANPAAPDTAITAEARAAVGNAEPGTIIVPYVPDSVRRQIKKELKAEVLAEAKAGNWAAPNEIPEWTKRIKIYGDIRVREEGIFNDKTNSPFFPNFASINAGTGFNINTSSAGFVNAPQLNTTEDRNRARIRMRLGINAKVADWITADVRLATGSDNSPVSTNQTLGGAGNFSKYSIWLDRASLRFTPLANLSVDVGRFENPFFSTDLLYDTDLNFDGIAAKAKYAVADGITMFGTAGAFPVFNTDLNFGSNSTVKTKSRDKYLASAEAGVDWAATDTIAVKGAVSYHHFFNIEGERSSLCSPPPTSADSCDTDSSRPQFQQFGNTVFQLRDIQQVADPAAAQLQYFGYASKFEVLDVHGRITARMLGDHQLTFEGDYVRNLAFNRSEIRRRYIDSVVRRPNPQQDLLVNNFGPSNADGTSSFEGGGSGWMARIGFGTPELKKWKDWNVGVSYRYLQSDAVVDGFTDSDFHLGGTNAKGFVVGGAFGIARNTNVSLRWLSADSITGPRFSNDVVQFDIVAGF